MRVAIIGRGKLGRALARALRLQGIAVSLLRGRGSPATRRAIAESSLVWIAVPDPFIEEVAQRIAPFVNAAHSVVHASGSWSPALLAACAHSGAHVGVCHPLISFGPRTSLIGASFVFDGDRRVRGEVARCVAALQGRLVSARVHGPRYHAAAALLANGATALAAEAERWIIAAGFPAKDAPRALGQLLASVAQNVAEMGPRKALTGPIARGDARAVARHLAVLDDAERDVYARIATLILQLARVGGLTQERALEVEAALRARP
jgi:predicted short-subunit dehydrogenase-like oxidoreductase (DUF2520 family)